MQKTIETQGFVQRCTNRLLFRPNQIKVQDERSSNNNYVIHCFDGESRTMRRLYIECDNKTGLESGMRSVSLYVAKKLRDENIEPIYIETLNGVVVWTNHIRHLRDATRTIQYEA